MPHIYYHCGGVGQQNGYTPEPVPWTNYLRMTCGYKISASLPEHDLEKLTRRIDRRVATMGDIAMECFIEHLGRIPVFHSDVLFAGEYKGFGIGPEFPTVNLPPFPVYSDFLITYSFSSFGLTHAQASALETMLNIERYGCYLEVYDLTGGEIHPYSEPYTPLETEGPDE